MQTLLDQYKYLHAQGKFKGYVCHKFKNGIKKLIDLYKPETLLDYGCGKGYQYSEQNIHEEWGTAIPHLYDPAVHGLDTLPTGHFDGVICTDVLEHLPEEDLTEVINRLINYTNKFLFITIATIPAKKNLPDGRNCHLTIKSKDWWLELISRLRLESNKDINVYVIENDE